jgi:hypothetical protein
LGKIVVKLIVPAEYLPSMVNLLAREAYAVGGGEKIAPEVLKAMETGAAAGLISPVRRPDAETKAGRRARERGGREKLKRTGQDRDQLSSWARLIFWRLRRTGKWCWRLGCLGAPARKANLAWLRYFLPSNWIRKASFDC